MIRLFVTQDLAAGGAIIVAPEQAHYLTHVMRLTAGDELLLFNGRDGEWRAGVSQVARRTVALTVMAQVRPQALGPDLDLVVALVKRARLETIVEKAAELGVRRVRLAITERTNSERTRVDRLAAIAIEAAEQTGRLDAPAIEPPQKLSALLADWPVDRPLMFLRRSGRGATGVGRARRPRRWPLGRADRAGRRVFGQRAGRDPGPAGRGRSLARTADPARRHRRDFGADAVAGRARRSAGALSFRALRPR